MLPYRSPAPAPTPNLQPPPPPPPTILAPRCHPAPASVDNSCTVYAPCPGASADRPVGWRVPRDEEVPNFAGGRVLPRRCRDHVADNARAVRGFHRTRLDDRRRGREARRPRLRSVLLLPVDRLLRLRG